MRNFVQQAVSGQGSWIQRLEHPVLRLVSFMFSIGSAYQFRWALEPLDSGDPVQQVINTGISVGLGVLGYFLSRGLTHRFMRKESVIGYVPIFLVVEFLEIFCNYSRATLAIQHTAWLSSVPVGQQEFYMICTYMMYCCIPLVGPCLAIIDMDLERRKLPQTQTGQPVVVGRPPLRQQAPQVPQGQQRQQGQQAQQRQPQVPQGQQRQQAPQQVPQRQQSGQAQQRGAVSNPPPGVTRQPPLQPVQPELEPV